MTQPGNLAGGIPRAEDWIAREIMRLTRAQRHRPSMWKETFNAPGTLAIATGTSRTYNREGHPLTIISVTAAVGTAPSGADLIIDVLKNGSSIYTSATPPTIADGDNDVTADLPDDVEFDHGDYFTVSISQVGTTTPGSDLTVQIRAS